MQLPGLSDLTPLGRGGFATVYRARQVHLDRDVAVKVDDRVLRTERDRRRFLREVHAAARLSGHPHVVSVHDANFTPEGTPYLVMELCAGGSLADLVRREGRLPAERVRQLGVQLADALAVAHAEGVLHRDIKPGNILLDRYGTAKLADFGLAALLDAEGSSTVTRDSLSPSYAPPEAFAMAHPTPAADVYSLAATLYDLLAGRPPRPVPWPIESFDHLGEVLRSPVPPVPGVPRDLHEALVRALEPDVAHRTPSAARLRQELAGATTPRPPLQPRPQPAPRYVAPLSSPVPVKRKPWPLVVGAAVLAVVVAGGTWWWATRGTAAAGQPSDPTTTTGTTGTTGTGTRTDPPPYLAQCGTGFCVDRPTCYHGINNAGGQAATARRTADCSVEHFWEAFAGGWLSGPVPRVGSDELARAAEVAGVCTREAMLANTRPKVDTSTWEITAVGFTDGDRAYFHCLASEPAAGEVTTSAFGS
ncbi:serine/threonine-protein kinase [Saccharothrix syringae]|uniref:non-specific serine/threonine protein kinase n=1 Tax=Saccharothrix syringae TaxID=103733 RepID=A0A5Q0HC23_SACSY|nr:serine/threonine-protein kinase [Saccharothrix syringae]QFZ23360.1 serine/threonine protein kinase [Saccharothrix syringae]